MDNGGLMPNLKKNIFLCSALLFLAMSMASSIYVECVSGQVQRHFEEALHKISHQNSDADLCYTKEDSCCLENHHHNTCDDRNLLDDLVETKYSLKQIKSNERLRISDYFKVDGYPIYSYSINPRPPPKDLSLIEISVIRLII